jgi:DHA3 family macrolide efflux protein-like MFS transporter
MGAGLRYIRGWPGLVALIAAAMVLKIALTPAMSLLSLLVSEHFGGGAAQLSLLEAVTGVGIVVGGLGLSVWGGFQRKIFTTIAGMFGLGVGLLGLGVIPGDMFGMALVSGFALGFMVPMVDGPIMAIMQGVVTPEMQGRVFTMMGSLLWLTSPFSLALAGPISDWLGLQMWYLVAGVMSVGTALVMFNLPAIVHIEENANGTAPSTDTLTITQAEAKA